MDNISDTRPLAVKKAIMLLDEADKIADPELRATKMQGPIISLRDYLQENPATECGDDIERCMVNRLRDHAVRLSKDFSEPDQKQWIQSFALFVIADHAMRQVLAKRPDLKPWYEEFMSAIPGPSV
jgi:hypothetical protein